MVTLNCNLFQNIYYRCLSENLITILLAPQKMVDSKKQEMNMMISLSVILHYVHYFHPNSKMASRYKVMCGCECCISSKIIHSSLPSWHDHYLKKSQVSQPKCSKQKVWGKSKFAYMIIIKMQSCHIGVIFTPKHMTWQRQQCVHTQSQIMCYHTGNFYCDVVPNVQALIFLTRKQMIIIPTPVLQLVFAFIIWLHVLQNMAGFC